MTPYLKIVGLLFITLMNLFSTSELYDTTFSKLNQFINISDDCIDKARRDSKVKIACSSTIEPVCGCDAVTYDNECKASNAGVKRFTAGPCATDNKGGNSPKDDCIGDRSTKPCTSTPDNVCGCDGKTYLNPCAAERAGVKRFTKGPCGNDSNGSAGTDDCIGEKSTKPCNSIPENVCGCDGKTYLNPCAAERAGVRRFTKGPCENDSNGSAGIDDCIGQGSTKPCNSIAENVCGCDGKTYLNACFAEVAGVKRFKKGACRNTDNNSDLIDCVGQRITKPCNSIPDNVCGCDGKTYLNQCAAEAAGVRRFTKGACGNTDNNPEANDCIGQGSTRPCNSIPDNVCGCDGKTYLNACAAERAGVKRFVKGACNNKSNYPNSTGNNK